MAVNWPEVLNLVVLVKFPASVRTFTREVIWSTGIVPRGPSGRVHLSLRPLSWEGPGIGALQLLWG